MTTTRKPKRPMMQLRSYAEGVFKATTEGIEVSSHFVDSFEYLDHVIVLHAGRKQRRRKIVASAWHVPQGANYEDVISGVNSIDLGIIGDITANEAEYMVTITLNPITVRVTATDAESAILEAKDQLSQNWVHDDFDDSACTVSMVMS
jgi:hypothetical protein